MNRFTIVATLLVFGLGMTVPSGVGFAKERSTYVQSRTKNGQQTFTKQEWSFTQRWDSQRRFKQNWSKQNWSKTKR